MNKVTFVGHHKVGESLTFDRYSFSPLEAASSHRLDTVMQKLTTGFTSADIANAGLGKGILENRTDAGRRKRIADMQRAADRGRAAGFTVRVSGQEVGVLSLAYPAPEKPKPKQPLTIVKFVANTALGAVHPSLRTLRMYSMWFNNELLSAVTNDPDGLVEEAFEGSQAIADRSNVQTTGIIDSRAVVSGSDVIRVAEHEVDLRAHGFVLDSQETNRGIERQQFQGDYYVRERQPVFGEAA